MERPKYLEYRHRRDQISCYHVERTNVITLEKPAPALLRLVGKKTSAKRETFSEEWELELRTTDVRPDYSAMIKTQVTKAVLLGDKNEAGYEGQSNPETEFLSETVDRFGLLSDLHGTLPSPHILVFPEEPQLAGGEWERARVEILPTVGPTGAITGYSEIEVSYDCRVETFGKENGLEYADISFKGAGKKGSENDSVRQEFAVGGTARFAIREGYLMSATVVRSMANHLEHHVLTRTSNEEFRHALGGKEEAVGGMRL